MACFIYDKARQKFADGDLSWSSDTFKVLLVTSAYTPDPAADEFVDDAGAAVISGSESASLASKTSTAGVLDAADTVLSSVPSGHTGAAILLYRDTGDPTTDDLVAFIDDYAGLPITTSGSDINVKFPPDSNRIAKL